MRLRVLGFGRSGLKVCCQTFEFGVAGKEWMTKSIILHVTHVYDERRNASEASD